MKRTLLLLIVTIASFATIFGQQLSIQGRVTSTNSYPVEYATVVLQTSDSVFVSGGITDLRGRFQMDNLKPGNYNLAISSIGYATKNMTFTDFNKNTDLGNVVIDSTSIALSEVVITGSQVINQADRKIILPTAEQLKASTNGLSLLQQLQLNRITVDMMQKKVSLSGGETVQLRINGVEASVQEISALLPEDIVRVEHHDDPGLRYNGAGAVINYITRRKDKGGNIALELENSPHVWFGNNQASAKYNYKKSEFSTFYYGSYRSMRKLWRENTETFNFEDHTSLTRVEDGTPDKWAMYWHYVHLNYSYQEPEKYFFNATVRAALNGEPKLNYHSKLYPVQQPEDAVVMKDHSSKKEHRPSVDLYYQRELNNNQMVILNAVGTYTNTDVEREYSEQKGEELLADIFSKTDGDKYSIIGEGIYEKGFEKGRLSAGLKHTQSVSDNSYSGSTVAETNMKQADTYAYVEFQRKIKKFNYSIGVGANRLWFDQGGEGYTDYTFRPTVRMSYNFTENAFVRYRGRMYSTAPSLSNLSETEQIIDSLQVRRGNPNLKPATSFSNALTFNARKGMVSTNLYVAHFYHHKPMMEQIIRENDKFIRMVDNQDRWQKLNTELEVRVGPIQKLLTVSWATGVNYYDSKGHNYHHNYTNWYYRGSMMANYKNWMAAFQIQGHINDFYGETMTVGENFHTLMLTYKHKQCSFGVMSLNPFVDNWNVGSENRSALTPSKNKQFLKESSRLFAVSFTYNFSFGRKYESGSKRLDNQDNESGVLGGGK